MNTVVVANVASAWMMTGIIWFVQVVHYPLLSVVPVESARGQVRIGVGEPFFNQGW